MATREACEVAGGSSADQAPVLCGPAACPGRAPLSAFHRIAREHQPWGQSWKWGQMLGVAGILCTLQFHGPQWELWVGKWLGRQAVLLRNVPLDSGIVEGPRNSYGDAWGVGAQSGAEGWAGGLVRPCPQNQPPPPVLPFSWGRRLTGCRGCAPKPRPFQGLPLQECGCWNYLASPHQTPAETALPSSVCAGPQRFGWEALSLSLSLCLAREIPPLSARAGGGGWGSGSLRLSRPHCTGAQEEKRLTLGDPAGFQQGWV